jgi:plasmid stabilization system protein ParE
MSLPTIVSPEAEAQIHVIDAWWRANRRASPNLFVEELAAAFELLASAPEIGRRYPHPEVTGVRRLLLRATRHHVYYVPTSTGVVVLAVWGAVKGSGPDLPTA